MPMPVPMSEPAPWVLEVPQNTQLKGYAELRASYTDAYGTPWTAVERLRPTVKFAPGERFSIETTFEIHAEQGRYAPQEANALLQEQLGADLYASMLSMSGCTEAQMEEQTTRHIDEASDVIGLERLYFDVNLPVADLRIGRQAVVWGSALVFNPTDVFAEIIVAEPWRERRGVDATRLTVPIGERAQVTGVFGVDGLPDDDLTNPRGGLKGTLSLPMIGASAVTYADTSGGFAGLDLKGDAGVGWWVEGGWTSPWDEDEEGHLEVSAGLDYSFPVLKLLYVAGQVSYDGSGLKPDEYDWTGSLTEGLTTADCTSEEADTSATLRSGTMGRLYGVGLVQWSLTEDWSVSGTTLWNLLDGTGLVFPSVGLKTGNRLSLNVGAQVMLGEDGEFRPDPADLQVAMLDLSPLLPRWTATAWARWAL